MKRVFFYLILPISLFADFSLSICAIFQDEAPYLKEWIEFHKIQGVEHFFLYNNLSQDDFKSILEPYIQKGEVTLIHWPYTFTPGKSEEWLSIQCGAYLDCLKHSQSEWIAFIDIDEFLFCCDGTPLPSFLKDYQTYGGVVVNSVYFGTSGIEEIPEGALMIELLTQAGALDDRSLLSVKSVVRPQCIQGCLQPHTFLYKEGFFGVNSLFQPVLGRKATSVQIDKIRLNHYWTRTEKFFREKKMKWRNRYRGEDESFLERWRKEYTKRIDTTILQFVPELRKEMFAD